MVAYGADNLADWLAFTEAEFTAAVTSSHINMSQGHIIRFSKAVETFKTQGVTEQLKSATAYHVVSDIFQKAKALNEKYKISDKFAKGVADVVTKAKEMDEEYKIMDRVGDRVKGGLTAFDEKYKISETVQAKVGRLAGGGQWQKNSDDKRTASSVVIEQLEFESDDVHGHPA